MTDSSRAPTTNATALLSWRRLPFPTQWNEQFPAGGDLVVEIGFGDGRFTARRAMLEPRTRFVGLEVSSGSLLRAMRRLKAAGVDNVRLMKVGAYLGLQQLFAAGSVDAIVVNFPCPWPKERHLKHRLLQRRFLTLAASRLKVGGQLRLATDHPEYLEFALAEAAATGLFAVERPAAPADVFETKYALKWREQGKPLHYVVFRRNQLAAPQHAPWERPRIMPHALLAGELPASAPFKKVVLPYGSGHVILHEVAQVLDGEEGSGRWLVRATVEEPDLKQQLLVLAQQRQPGEVIVRLESFGDPLITPTTRGCVHAVTEWLLEATELRASARHY